MGCASSKHGCLPDLGPAADAHAWLQQYPSAGDLAVLALPAKDGVSKPPAADYAAHIQQAQPRTTIQDLPPHVLANILSRQDNWVELFRCIPLVCKAWHQLALTATPHSLQFAFDVEQPHQPGKLTGLAAFPGLQRLAAWHMLLQRQQQRRRRQQQQSCMQRQGSFGSCCNRRNSSSSPVPEEAPWAEWLRQHVPQAREVSIVISAAAPGCASQQHQLKDEALEALCSSSNSGSSSLTSRTSSTDTSSNSMGVADGAASDSSSSRSSSSNSATGQLQLRALELQLPLFEHDVQMLAKHISNKAPLLERLTLIGYTSSTGSSSSSHQVPAPLAEPPLAPLPPPAQQQQQQQPAQAQQAPAQQPGSGGQAGVAQQGTVNTHTADSSAASSSSSNRQREASQQIIRQGYITGACLQHLLASSSSLRSLTFARRQLYKTAWLAPAAGLTHLALRDCQLGEQCLVELASLKLPALLHLDLSLNPALGYQRSRAGSRAGSSSPSSATCSSLELVCRRFTQLTALDISGWNLAPPSAAASTVSSSSSSSSCSSPWATFAPLSQLRQLAELRADGCGVVQWRAGPCSALQQLTRLSLSGNPLSSAAVMAVCSMQQLRRVELAGLTASAAAAAGGPGSGEAAAAAYQRLVRLHVNDRSNTADHSSSSGGGDGSDCSWAGLRGLSGVTELNLSGNCLCLPESSFRVFRRHFCPGLADMASLVRLDLSYCRFPYKLLRLLVSGLPASVADVVLDGCVSVTSGDLQVLALLPGLRRLSVSNMQPALRDKHAEVLSRLASLRVLLLAGNDVGPKGVCVLLQGLTQLAMLDVSDNAKLKRGYVTPRAACTASHCQVIS